MEARDGVIVKEERRRGVPGSWTVLERESVELYNRWNVGHKFKKRIKKYSLVSGWANSVEKIILLLLSVIIIIINDNSENALSTINTSQDVGGWGTKKEKRGVWYWIGEVWYDLRWQVRGSKRHLDRQLHRKLRDDWLRDDNIWESWTLQWNSSSCSFI